jgi:S-formylglutathione hydrolase
MTSSLETISTVRVFGGTQTVCRHASTSTATNMEFCVFVPDQANAGPLPVLYYLSGLTCTWENVMAKAGVQRYAAEHGLIIIAPDTSPRGEDVPNDDGYDFGQGAGFYVNAIQEPWSTHFHMYDYVVQELPQIINVNFPVDAARCGVFGHSMGGHGALTIALKNPDIFKSVSAFSPIVTPSQVPWGHKAFGGYLGADQGTWADYDACTLVASRGWTSDILIDQGLADQFLEEQLKPELFEQACDKKGVPLTLRLHEGYDHSYYFISTFMGDHIRWHAERLAE